MKPQSQRKRRPTKKALDMKGTKAMPKTSAQTSGQTSGRTSGQTSGQTSGRTSGRTSGQTNGKESQIRAKPKPRKQRQKQSHNSVTQTIEHVISVEANPMPEEERALNNGPPQLEAQVVLASEPPIVATTQGSNVNTLLANERPKPQMNENTAQTPDYVSIVKNMNSSRQLWSFITERTPMQDKELTTYLLYYFVRSHVADVEQSLQTIDEIKQEISLGTAYNMLTPNSAVANNQSPTNNTHPNWNALPYTPTPKYN